jgi:hypothetical protein
MRATLAATLIAAFALLAVTARSLSTRPIHDTIPYPVCTGACVGGIDESSTTTESFIGFYALTDSYDEEHQQFVCPALVVSPTDRPLFEYFAALVEQGNTVNSLDGNGRLRLKIDFDGLSEADVQEIKAATMNEPVTVHVQKKILGGKGAAGCTSFVTILSSERTAR